MLKHYGYRTREQRVNDAKADALVKAARQTASATTNTDLLLGKLISEVQLSNLIAIVNSDEFSPTQRKQAFEQVSDLLEGK